MKKIVKNILHHFYKNSDADSHERVFLDKNVAKHARVLWVTAVVFVLSIIGMSGLSQESVSIVLTATLGPVMLLGGAWFAVSFGGIPERLLEAAMDITFWMFSAFMAALTIAMVAISFVTPIALWPIWILIIFGVWTSCVQYDTADGFKAGLDEATLEHARYAIEYYKKEGVSTNKKKSD